MWRCPRHSGSRTPRARSSRSGQAPNRGPGPARATLAAATLPPPRPPPPGLRPQPLLERLELLTQLGGQLVAEPRVVSVDLRELFLPAFGVHLEQLGHRLGAHVEPVDVDAPLAQRGNQPDRCLIGARVLVAA